MERLAKHLMQQKVRPDDMKEAQDVKNTKLAKIV